MSFSLSGHFVSFCLRKRRAPHPGHAATLPTPLGFGKLGDDCYRAPPLAMSYKDRNFPNGKVSLYPRVSRHVRTDITTAVCIA